MRSFGFGLVCVASRRVVLRRRKQHRNRSRQRQRQPQQPQLKLLTFANVVAVAIGVYVFWEPLQHRTKQRLAARVRQLATAALHASLPANAPVVICILVIVVFVAVVFFIVWWARQFTFL